MDIRVYYCGTLDDDIKPENMCNSVKEQFDSLSDTLYAVSKIEFENVQTDCGKLDMCEENCVYELHSPVSTVTDPWGLTDLKKDQDDPLTPGDVYCYENCMSVIGSSFDGLEIEDLPALNWRKCPKL